MTFKTLFEKEVFVRVSEDQSTLICTTKWPLLSIIRRFGVEKAGPVNHSRAGPDSAIGRVRGAISRV